MQSSNSKSTAFGCLMVFLAVFGFVSLLVGTLYLVFVVSGSLNNMGGDEVDDELYNLVGIIFIVFFYAVSIACITVFIVMLRKSKRAARQEDMIRSYIALIGNKKNIPIKWLAQQRNISQEKVVTELFQVMSRGIFTNGYISEKTNTLFFPNDNSMGPIQFVTCRNCGAGVEIRAGYPGKCTYCSAAISD